MDGHMIFRFEDDAGNLIVDFLSIDGLRLVADSFSYTPLPDGSATSTFNLVMESADEADPRAAAAELEAQLKSAINYHQDQLQVNAVWWRWHQNNEPPGRSLLSDFQITYPASIFSGPLLEGTGLQPVLAITHAAQKEATTENSATAYNLAANGGRLDLAATFDTGPLNGRIPVLKLDSGILNGPYKRIWAGILPARTDISAFRAELACSEGTDISADCGNVADSGFVKEIDFTAGTELTNRFHLTLEDILIAGATWHHYTGKFLVLMKYRTQETTTETVVRLTSSIGSPTQTGLTQSQSVEYPNPSTTYRIMELGEIQIPPTAYRRQIADNTQLSFANYSLNLEAGRIAGTGYLRVRNFYLIPTDHFLYIENGDYPQPQNFIYTLPDDEIVAYNVDYASATGQQNPCTVSPRNWRYPHQGGTLVILGTEGTAGTALFQNITITNRQRWLTYQN